MSLKLILIEETNERAEALRRVFAGNKRIEIEKVDRILYLHPPRGLDVLYLSGPAAERWGSRPLIHRSQVLTTSLQDQEQGMPPFIVTGPVLAPGERLGPTAEISLFLNSIFDAIRQYRTEHHAKMEIVGIWAENLLNGISPVQLPDLIYHTVPELRLAVR